MSSSNGGEFSKRQHAPAEANISSDRAGTSTGGSVRERGGAWDARPRFVLASIRSITSCHQLVNMCFLPRRRSGEMGFVGLE